MYAILATDFLLGVGGGGGGVFTVKPLIKVTNNTHLMHFDLHF